MRKIKLVQTLKPGLYQAKANTGRTWKYVSNEQGRPVTMELEALKQYCIKEFGECKFY